MSGDITNINFLLKKDEKKTIKEMVEKKNRNGVPYKYTLTMWIKEAIAEKMKKEQ